MYPIQVIQLAHLQFFNGMEHDQVLTRLCAQLSMQGHSQPEVLQELTNKLTRLNQFNKNIYKDMFQLKNSHFAKEFQFKRKIEEYQTQAQQAHIEQQSLRQQLLHQSSKHESVHSTSQTQLKELQEAKAQIQALNNLIQLQSTFTISKTLLPEQPVELFTNIQNKVARLKQFSQQIVLQVQGFDLQSSNQEQLRQLVNGSMLAFQQYRLFSQPTSKEYKIMLQQLQEIDYLLASSERQRQSLQKTLKVQSQNIITLSQKIACQEDQITTKQQQLSTRQCQIINLNKQLQLKEHDLQSCLLQNSDLQNQISSLESETASSQLQIESLHCKILQTSQRMENCDFQLASLVLENQQAKTQLSSLKDQRQQLTKRNSQIKGQLISQERKVNLQTSKIQELQRMLLDFTEEQLALQQANSHLTNQLNKALLQVAQLTRMRSSLHDQLLNQRQDCQGLKEAVTKTQQNNLQLSLQIEKLKKQKEELTEQLAHSQKLNKALTDSYQDTQKQLKTSLDQHTRNQQALRQQLIKAQGQLAHKLQQSSLQIILLKTKIQQSEQQRMTAQTNLQNQQKLIQQSKRQAQQSQKQFTQKINQRQARDKQQGLLKLFFHHAQRILLLNRMADYQLQIVRLKELCQKRKTMIDVFNQLINWIVSYMRGYDHIKNQLIVRPGSYVSRKVNRKLTPEQINSKLRTMQFMESVGSQDEQSKAVMQAVRKVMDFYLRE